MATEPISTVRPVLSRNPATNETLAEIPTTSPADVAAAVERARVAQAPWARVSIGERAGVIRRFGRLLYEAKDEVSRLIASETGKPVAEALVTEVLVVLDAAKFAAHNAYRVLRDERVPHGNPVMKTKVGKLVRAPYGVVGIISPWNYPFSIPTTETVAALVAGNAVVLKPSEWTSLCARKLHELAIAAGVPRDVFQVVYGFGETGAALVSSSVDKVVFTGSVATGRRVGIACAERLIPCVLELGGKDPMIVLDDADLDVVTSGALWAAFMNCGQTCLSVERCYVARPLYERFLAMVVEKTKRLRVGHGLDRETDVGPMIHEQQLRVVEAHVEDARQRGARVLCGGERLPQLGPNFYAPTVIADCDHTMRVVREETFGPVLPVMPFDTEDEAVRKANDSEFGLAASVWTTNRRRGEAVARRLQAGTVMINDAVACFGIAEAPHGGVKSSGTGRTHGRLGLEEMVRVKYVDSDLLPRMKKPWWFGYGAKYAGYMAGLTDALFARSPIRKLGGWLRASGAVMRKKV